MSEYKPQPGDIGLCKITGAGGKAIRFAQWLNGDGFHDYEHAFVYVGDGEIVEAMPGGAVRVKNWHPEAVYLRCPVQYRNRVALVARQLVGTPYSFADYASIAAHRLHIPAPHLWRYIATSKHMICSQLADCAAEAGGWQIFDDGRWPGDVTPGDLYREYQKQA
jgi:uncharacterized protein YycO